MIKKTNVKKVATVAAVVGVIAGALLGGISGALIAYDSSKIADLNTKLYIANQDIKTLENAEPVIVTETVEVLVPVEVPVNVSVEVPVDNGNLELVLNEVYEADGSVEYLIEDLDEDEMDQVVGRIVMIQDAKTLALAELEAEAFDELDLVNFNATTQFDEDELYRLDADSEDITVVDVDFDSDDVELVLPFTFKMDGVKYSAEATVVVEDNDVENFDISNIQLV